MSDKTRLELERQSDDQHRDLRVLMSDFSKQLTGPAEQGVIEAKFDRLQHELEEHFALEEDGGYFEEVLTEAPWLSREVDALRDQHAAFLRDLLEIEGLVAKKKRGWKDVAFAFRRLRRRLLQHENRENRLAQKALVRDLGGAD